MRSPFGSALCCDDAVGCVAQWPGLPLAEPVVQPRGGVRRRWFERGRIF